MNRARQSITGLVAAGLALAASGGVAQELTADVKGWLDRMNTAVERLNYRGTFVHAVDGNSELLQIVHRYADGAVQERINSTVDDGREILRTAEAVRSVFPGKRLVVIEEPDGSSIPFAASLSYADELTQHYNMNTFTRGHVAERETQIVSIRARDQYRYGYLLWLDRESALPLKIQVRNEDSQVIESILFTEIEILDSIPESAVAPLINTEGFEMRRRIEAEFESSGPEIWGATRLPNGFRLSLSQRALLAGSRYPVQHLVYSDGLATVSVFIAHPRSDADMPEGFSRYGSTNAYSLKIDGRLATAMGEVPGRTVQRIATSLDAR